MKEARLIDANALKTEARKLENIGDNDFERGFCWGVDEVVNLIESAPTIDAEPVVHCKDCVYYHKPHVQRNDGTECDISEVPDEYKPFPLTNMCNSDYGINVGGKCEYDNNYAPYEDDKTVFRKPEDFCSRGRRKE